MDSVLKELDRLKGHLQKQLHEKLESIERAARTTRTIGIVTTLVALGLGVAFSFAISRSIVEPLAELKRRAEATEDEFDDGADFSRMPEIRDLAATLSEGRRKLQDTATMNVSLIRSINDQFETPLLSVKKRVSHLKEDLTEIITEEQTRQIDILADEIERLMQRFSQLPRQSSLPLAAPRHETPKGAYVSQPGVSSRRTFDDRASFFGQTPRQIKSLVKRAWSLGAGSWNAVRDSIANAGIGKGEKR